MAIATLIENADGELAHTNQALVDERSSVKIYRLRLAWGRRVEIGFRIGSRSGPNSMGGEQSEGAQRGRLLHLANAGAVA